MPIQIAELGDILSW